MTWMASVAKEMPELLPLFDEVIEASTCLRAIWTFVRTVELWDPSLIDGQV